MNRYPTGRSSQEVSISVSVGTVLLEKFIYFASKREFRRHFNDQSKRSTVAGGAFRRRGTETVRRPPPCDCIKHLSLHTAIQIGLRYSDITHAHRRAFENRSQSKHQFLYPVIRSYTHLCEGAQERNIVEVKVVVHWLPFLSEIVANETEQVSSRILVDFAQILARQDRAQSELQRPAVRHEMHAHGLARRRGSPPLRSDLASTKPALCVASRSVSQVVVVRDLADVLCGLVLFVAAVGDARTEVKWRTDLDLDGPQQGDRLRLAVRRSSR